MGAKSLQFKIRKSLVFTAFVGLLMAFSVSLEAQVTFEKEVKISDEGLFFDGVSVGTNANAPNNEKYDYAFGSRITPHGDCIKEYNGFIFMTWYRGGEDDRHVMLSRYNPTTGVTKTIEFGHRHNGYLNNPHIGESHNTIAIGICPIDGTIHMLYDMHAYSEDRPSNGSLANDYFRYSFSKKDAATVPDNQFTLNQFVKDTDGDFKHLKMRNGTDYKSLTYPNFFLNKRGELFMWIREGGNTNGAYKFCKYDGNSWSDFTQFNIMNARRNAGVANNWGLYGDIKFSGGKMRIGFAKREGNNTDKFRLNNGFYYAYTDDPNGKNQWRDANDNNIQLPIIDAEILKVSEPTDILGINGGVNTINMTAGADWIVTDRGDIHSVTTVGQGSDNRKNVHTYRKAGESNFRTSTSFPGGNLYTFKDEVYLIGLSGGRIFVEKADGGTNNWTRIYQAPNDTKRFRHGNVYISEAGKLYFYLMEQKTGSAQPLYLQIFDLGLDTEGNQAPTVTITSPADGATLNLGEEITLRANASDADGNLDKVNFKINDAFYKTVTTRPFETTFTPDEEGTYKIAALAIDQENAREEVFITVNVVRPNDAPTVSITSPVDGAIFELGDQISFGATASDPDGNLDKVNFFVNGQIEHSDNTRPFSDSFTPTEIGTYEIMARAIDRENSRTDAVITITVIEKNEAPVASFSTPVVSVLEEGYGDLVITVDAIDPDGDNMSVLLKMNGEEIRNESVAPYEWGHAGSPNPEETLGLLVGDHVLEAIITDSKGASTTIEKTITVDRITSTTSVLDKNELTVYPNPSESGLFILSEEVEFEIHHPGGNMIKSGVGNSLDISELPKGIYYLKTPVKTLKLIKP